LSARCAAAGQSVGYRRDWKKAYVKLAEGEKMIGVRGESVRPVILKAEILRFAQDDKKSARWE